MRIALLSDIHSNIQALEAALESLEAQGIDEIWSPGDFVNYGADPAAIMEWAIKEVTHAVLGNHDAVITDQELPDYFNRYAQEAIPYTREHLSPHHLRWLGMLPYEKVINGVRLVHASPLYPEQWTYIMGRSQAMSLFRTFHESLCFFGHTHIQVAYDSKGNQFYKGTILLEDDRKYLINPGSVGQPRDGDPRWAAAIYDTEEHTLEFLRGKYDVDGAVAHIFDAHLPKRLGYRLYQGQ